MEKKVLTQTVVVSAATLFAATADAALLFTNSAVVGSPSNVATFNTLTTVHGSGPSLSNYQEAGIRVAVADDSSVGFNAFNNGTTSGFHYGIGGNTSWVEISLAGGGVMKEVDFLLGDGYASTNTNFFWEVFSGLTSIGSGNALLAKGSTVGWSDAGGFTRLRVAAFLPGDPSGFGRYQAIALDNVRVGSPSNVPEPQMFGLIGLGLIGTCLTRRKS